MFTPLEAEHPADCRGDECRTSDSAETGKASHQLLTGFTVRVLVRNKLPSLPYEKIAREILGSDYSLSIVFIGKTRSRRLNCTYRKKDKPANVLAFPLSKTEGELFLTPSLFSPQELPHMFIHGLLHLNGLDHGTIMEQKESFFLSKFFQWHDISSPVSM